MVDFVPEKSEITVKYAEGESKLVELHDGSKMQLHKLASGWDPTSRQSAAAQLHESRAKGEILTGLIYIDTESRELHEILNTVKKPLNSLTEKDLTPSQDILAAINAGHR